MDSFYLVCLSALIFFMFLLLSFGLAEAKRKNDPYSFLSKFPYELFSGEPTPFLVMARVALGAYLVSGLGLDIAAVVAVASISGLKTYAIFFSAFGLISLAAFFSLAIVEARFVEAHLRLAFIYFLSALLHASMEGIFLIAYGGIATMPFVFAIVIFLLALIEVGVLLNPKLSHWAQLESVGEKDGSVTLRRPKVFVLAFSEWLVFFIDFLVLILFAIGLLLA